MVTMVCGNEVSGCVSSLQVVSVEVGEKVSVHVVSISDPCDDALAVLLMDDWKAAVGRHAIVGLVVVALANVVAVVHIWSGVNLLRVLGSHGRSRKLTGLPTINEVSTVNEQSKQSTSEVVVAV